MQTIVVALPLTDEQAPAIRRMFAPSYGSSSSESRVRPTENCIEAVTLHEGTTGNFLAVRLGIEAEHVKQQSTAGMDAYLELISPDLRKLVGSSWPGQSAQELFTWDDDRLAPSERGEHALQITLRRLSPQSANELRDLVHQLHASHFDGLVERARQVRYYKESMHLQPFGQDELLVVHLEHVGGNLPARIQAYPDTDFTRWWNPKFRGLLGGTLRLPGDRVEVLFRRGGP